MIFWIWLKKWWWILLAFLGLGVTLAFLLLKRKPKAMAIESQEPRGEVSFQLALAETKLAVLEARTKASLELQAVRAKEETVKEEVRAISSIEDKSVRRAALIQLAKRQRLLEVLLALSLASLAQACAHETAPSPIAKPKEIMIVSQFDLDDVMPKPGTVPPCGDSSPRFEPRPTEKGIELHECQFQEENVLGIAKLKRLDQEIVLLKALRKQEFDLFRRAEEIYQGRLKDLSRPPSWWESHRWEIGIALGVGTAVLSGWTMSQLRATP